MLPAVGDTIIEAGMRSGPLQSLMRVLSLTTGGGWQAGGLDAGVRRTRRVNTGASRCKW